MIWISGFGFGVAVMGAVAWLLIRRDRRTRAINLQRLEQEVYLYVWEGAVAVVAESLDEARELASKILRQNWNQIHLTQRLSAELSKT